VTDTVPRTWQDINAWRKARRVELIARREAVPAEERQRWNDAITKSLEAGLAVPPGTIVGFCWPFKGEFDARYAVRHWRDRGAIAALPEVTGKGQPLQFRKWWPGAPMRRGVYDIPFPADTDVVVPDIAIVPMNGYDELGYRLGYGGGYFDRTLAKWRGGMVAIGVTYEALRLATIYPQPHDIPMDLVVTETGIHRAAGGRLQTLEAGDAGQHVRQLLAARGLPRAAPIAPADAGYTSPPCYASEFPGYFGDEPTQRPK
jgi:5,10-methenyltetrahydrofolate synthetase